MRKWNGSVCIKNSKIDPPRQANALSEPTAKILNDRMHMHGGKLKANSTDSIELDCDKKSTPACYSYGWADFFQIFR